MVFGSTTPDERRASGVFALGEIVRMLYIKDPVYLATRIELIELVDRLKQLEKSSNSSLKRQIEIALDKAQQAGLGPSEPHPSSSNPNAIARFSPFNPFKAG